jgi:hypothetical protein
MSKFKVNVYDKNTGKFVHRGYNDNPKVIDLTNQGHISVESGVTGGAPDWLMWDFNTGQQVPDFDRRNEDVQREVDKDNKRQRKKDIYVILETNYGNRGSDGETIDLLNELARLYA